MIISKPIDRQMRRVECGEIMSSNNQILIKQVGEKWQATDLDVDCGGGKLVSDEPFETLEEAIDAANEYQAGREVEYGLKVVLPRRKVWV